MSTPTNNEVQQAFFVQNQMSEAKSPFGVFSLPCGVMVEGELVTEVQVREITGEEEDLLGARNMDGGKKITQLLAGCLVRLGAVTDKDALLGHVRDMTLGDRVFLMFAIRRVTLGDELPCEEKCPECGKTDSYVADLGALKVKNMPNPKQRIYDVVLPSGGTARYHIMTGKDEEKVSKLDARDQGSAVLLSRLDMLNGNPVTLDAVKKMPMRDRNFLRDQFEDVEGGVETGMDFACPNCSHEFVAELNPGTTGFFFPSRARKTSRRSTSAS